MALLRRDLRLAMRRRADVLTTLLFFVIVASLFPLAIGPEPKLLREIGPGVLWVGALLACMLALNRLYQVDYHDGSLEQLLLAPHPLSVLVIAKVFALWLTTGLPLVCIAPLLGLQYGLDGETLWTLTFALFLGTPVLSLIGSIGASLTLGVRGGGVLIALLVLPLYVPVLIFGAGAAQAVMSGQSAAPHLSLLGALLFGAAALAPWASAAALRIALD